MFQKQKCISIHCLCLTEKKYFLTGLEAHSTVFLTTDPHILFAFYKKWKVLKPLKWFLSSVFTIWSLKRIKLFFFRTGILPLFFFSPFPLCTFSKALCDIYCWNKLFNKAGRYFRPTLNFKAGAVAPGAHGGFTSSTALHSHQVQSKQGERVEYNQVARISIRPHYRLWSDFDWMVNQS